MGSKLDDLTTLLKQAPATVILQTHDVPDPDAIAAAFGLQYLLQQRGIHATIIYNRVIEKTDTKKMLELFDIEVTEFDSRVQLCQNDWAVLIDSQKGSGNVLDLPTRAIAVIDHHNLRPNSNWLFADIRPAVGSCSTIIAEYFFDNNVPIPKPIATALLYGIFIDTDYLLRAVSDLDALMFYKLHSLADRQQLLKLRSSQLSRQELALYAAGFANVEIYGQLGFLELGLANDSLIGAANDLLLSVSEVEVAICYSVRQSDVKISVRSSNPAIKANELAQCMVTGLGFGGGHSHMAGGLIPVENLPAGKGPGLLIRYRSIAFMEQLELLNS